jgi:hypothetical protein
MPLYLLCIVKMGAGDKSNEPWKPPTFDKNRRTRIVDEDDEIVLHFIATGYKHDNKSMNNENLDGQKLTCYSYLNLLSTGRLLSLSHGTTIQ